MENECSASDPEATNAVPLSCGQGSISIARPGDLSFDCQVAIDEVIRIVREYLGLDPPSSVSEYDCDGVIAINEVIKAINCYLETEACPCGG